jgi:hypothetical protein
MYGSSRQIINKERLILNKPNYRPNAPNGYLQSISPSSYKCTFFSHTHNIFSKMNKMLGKKTSLSSFMKIKITSSIFSNHNRLKVKINDRRNFEKFTSITLEQIIKEGIKREKFKVS